MKYSVKCSVCEKEKICEPEIHGGIRVFLVSYTCDKCKKKTIEEQKVRENLTKGNTVKEYHGTPILVPILNYLKKLDDLTNGFIFGNQPHPYCVDCKETDCDGCKHNTK